MPARNAEPFSIPLAELLAGWCEPGPAGTLLITGLSNDSRAVRAGDLFMAVPGQRTSGARYLDQAVTAGARAILVDASETLTTHPQVPVLSVSDLAGRQGPIAARFHGQPSQGLTCIGITGTNGKTSCSHFLAQALPRCGILGTEGNGFPGRLEAATHTTPDALALQAWLARLRDDGARNVAMEVSSHAVHQQRIAGTHFDTAVFTNLGHDHLDYHRDFDDYAAAKASLFASPGLRAAVVNADDDYVDRITAALAPGVRLLTYGIRKGDLRGSAVARPGGLMVEIDSPQGRAQFASALLGEFNLYNLLAVLGTLLLADVPFADAIDKLKALSPVAGRMQTLRQPGAPLVVIDYAHNPPALTAVLRALREHLPSGGRLWCVFGCGGERDAAKRPLMGELATRLADQVVVTDDNPRGEAPADIAAAILAGMPSRNGVELIHDRAAAIRHAVHGADLRDVVVIAGKGAERYQVVAGRRLPFSDFECAQAALKGRP